MNTLKLGSKGGSDLDLLTKFLGIDSRWDFDLSLEEIVKDFQKSADLIPDGIVGYKTWRELILNYREKNRPGNEVTDWDYQMFSDLLGCEPEALKAVKKVETGGKSGFEKTGKPQILFEGHVFWRELVKLGIDPETLLDGNEDILYKVQDRTKYIGGVAEWSRFEKAAKINKIAAIKSASWGMFQIMGFNYALCGCPGVEKFYNMMNTSQFYQFVLGMEFLHQAKLVPFLKEHNWTEFAKRYNGPNYSKNSYNRKLKSAFLAFLSQK